MKVCQLHYLYHLHCSNVIMDMYMMYNPTLGDHMQSCQLDLVSEMHFYMYTVNASKNLKSHDTNLITAAETLFDSF